MSKEDIATAVFETLAAELTRFDPKELRKVAHFLKDEGPYTGFYLRW